MGSKWGSVDSADVCVSAAAGGIGDGDFVHGEQELQGPDIPAAVWTQLCRNPLLPACGEGLQHATQAEGSEGIGTGLGVRVSKEPMCVLSVCPLLILLAIIDWVSSNFIQISCYWEPFHLGILFYFLIYVTNMLDVQT